MNPEHRPPRDIFNHQEQKAIKDHYDPRPALQFYEFDPTTPIDSSSTCHIFKGTDKESGRPVALKFITSLTKDRRITVDQIQGYALREFELSYVRLHPIKSPYLLKPIDIVSDETLGFGLVTAWAEKGSLADHLDKAELEKTAWEFSASYGIQIALGLAALHQHGIVYRDLKPENIFITQAEHISFGSCAIGDFGISAPASYLQKPKTNYTWDSERIRAALMSDTIEEDMWNDRFTPIRHTTGTPEYLSPEQAKGDSMTPASDLFSLGTILFELIDGGVPFSGSTPKEVMRNIVTKGPRKIEHPLQRQYRKQSANTRRIIYSLLIKPLEERGVLQKEQKQTMLQKLLRLPPDTQTVYMHSAQDVARELAMCWQGSGSPIEQTPWFREALTIHTDTNPTTTL